MTVEPGSGFSGRQPWFFPRRILVADHEPESLASILDALQGLGCTVRAVSRGESVLSLVKSFRPGLVILDLQLPDVDSYEVFRAIRHDKEASETLVIVTHGSPTDDDIRRAFALNSDCFLTKPVHPEELSRFVARILGASEG